jgi:uncharacterized membrane protein
MDKEIAIGLIIGLLFYTLNKISKSARYSRIQKNILYVSCILFFPFGLLLLTIMYLTTPIKD